MIAKLDASWVVLALILAVTQAGGAASDESSGHRNRASIRKPKKKSRKTQQSGLESERRQRKQKGRRRPATGPAGSTSSTPGEARPDDKPTDVVQLTLDVPLAMRNLIVEGAARANMTKTAYCQAAVEVECSNWREGLDFVFLTVDGEPHRIPLPTARTRMVCPCHDYVPSPVDETVAIALSMTRAVREQLKDLAALRGLSVVDYIKGCVLVERWNYDHRSSDLSGSDADGPFTLLLLHADLRLVTSAPSKAG